MEMSLPFFLVKNVLSLLAKNKRKKFEEACRDPQKVQEQLKKKILAKSLRPFPSTPTTYSDYSSVEQLTKSPVLFHETTSGSTGAKKRIPYNKDLLKSYQNMFLLWSHDLVFHSHLKINKAKTFISISPQIGKDTDDRKYLSGPIRILLSPFLVSFPEDHKASSSDDFLFKISSDLLKAKDLEIVSIWSPTYFLSILRFIEINRHKFNLPPGKISWPELWPQLKLISCWMNAGAALSAGHLKKEFPNVRFQAKGLLSTEGPITIPWSRSKGEVPLLTEAYLEFMDEKGAIFPLSEIQLGKSYIVLSTQQNGFLRYNTLDEVKVTDFYYNTPILEFLGRSGGYSDLAGEKLSERNLLEIFAKAEATFLFIPNVSSSIPFYEVLTEKESTENWDEKLQTLYHYKLARSLGQLDQTISKCVLQLRQLYLDFYQQKGLGLGDIKEKHLMTQVEEAAEFREWIELKSLSSHPRSMK
jgi:hypothetical protein